MITRVPPIPLFFLLSFFSSILFHYYVLVFFNTTITTTIIIIINLLPKKIHFHLEIKNKSKSIHFVFSGQF